MRKKIEDTSTRSIINLSSTSLFSEGEQTQRSMEGKKRIVLSSRRGETILFKKNAVQEIVEENNKQNRNYNTIIMSNRSKEESQYQQKTNQSQDQEQEIGELESSVKERNFQSQSHFYMESSVDQPVVIVKKKKKHHPVINKVLKHLNISNNIIMGCKTLKCSLIRKLFANIKMNQLQNSIKVQQNEQINMFEPIICFNQLKAMEKMLERWINRTVLGNIKRYVTQTAQNQIHIAVQIIKKRDYQLSYSSKILCARILSFVLQKQLTKLKKIFLKQLKMKPTAESTNQHQKVYSFSSSFNSY